MMIIDYGGDMARCEIESESVFVCCEMNLYDLVYRLFQDS